MHSQIILDSIYVFDGDISIASTLVSHSVDFLKFGMSLVVPSGEMNVVVSGSIPIHIVCDYKDG